MDRTRLRQLLDFFEESPRGLSLPEVARQLNLTVPQVENLLEFWIRRGRIRRCQDQPDCTVCGEGAGCPYAIDMPPYYELVRE